MPLNFLCSGQSSVFLPAQQNICIIFWAPVLPAGLAVNPVCLAQGDQCRFSSLCGTDFPAALNTPGPCPLILGPAWDKEAAAPPFCQQMWFQGFLTTWSISWACDHHHVQWSQGVKSVEIFVPPGSSHGLCVFLLKAFTWLRSHSLLCCYQWFHFPVLSVCSVPSLLGQGQKCVSLSPGAA